MKNSAGMAGGTRLGMFCSLIEGNESFWVNLLQKEVKVRSSLPIRHRNHHLLRGSIIQRNGCVGVSKSFV